MDFLYPVAVFLTALSPIILHGLLTIPLRFVGHIDDEKTA